MCLGVNVEGLEAYAIAYRLAVVFTTLLLICEAHSNQTVNIQSELKTLAGDIRYLLHGTNPNVSVQRHHLSLIQL